LTLRRRSELNKLSLRKSPDPALSGNRFAVFNHHLERRRGGQELVDNTRIKYGFGLIIIGFVVVLIVFGVAASKWNTAADVVAVIGSVTGVVGTIVSAFFGIHAGAAGKERVEAQRDRAQEQALELAGQLPPDKYEALRVARKDLFGPV
jgi:hypothetical protein